MRNLPIAILCSLLLAAGCGGDDDSVDCSAFAACGGDVVGTWRYGGSCEGENSFCPELTIQARPSISGSFTFNSDGTYTSMGTTNGQSRYTIPASCLMGLTDCSQLELDASDSCTGDAATSCSCTTTYNNVQESDSGNYVITGTTIALDGDTADPYCVEGNQMRVDFGDGNLLVLVK